MAGGINSGGSKVAGHVTTASLWARVATALLAAAIFVADTATPFEFSVSVLYVVVILMAGRFLRRRGTALVAAACVILAVTSAILTPPKGEAFLGVANTLISIAAITITSFLVLQSQAREVLLKEHAEEREHAEEKVRQQEKELREVLDFTPQLMAVFGVDRKRLYANRPSLAYLGLTLEQWQGITDPLWFFHPDDRERVAKEVYAGSGSEGPHEFEARFLRADGEYRWFLFRDNPLRDEQGRIVRWYLSAMDIEDRRRAEEELRNTAAELQRVMNSVSDCLWSAEFDEHGKWTYQYYSPAVQKITGRSVSFFMQGPDAWFGIVHPEDKTRVAVAAERLISGQVEQAEGEYRIIHANGDVRWIRDSGVVTRSGLRIRITGVVSDITARKRAEDELLRSEGYLSLAQMLTHTGSFAWDAKDDDLSVRESLQSLIRSAGLGVRVFSSAEQFLTSSEPGDANCLVLDVRMPGMSGTELHRHLLSKGYKIPVIFITAHASDQETREQALSDGALDYLIKPFHKSELLDAIFRALGSNAKQA